METTITIRFIEQKPTKAGKPFWKIEAADGKKYNCFDNVIAGQLKPGSAYNVEIVESNGYFHIAKLIGANANPQPLPATSSYEDKHKEKLASVLTSYEKDAVIAGKQFDAVANYKRILSCL